MWRRLFITVLLVGLGVALVTALVWPIIEQELMTSPVVEGVAAVRSGNIARLRACFTDDARVTVKDFSAPIDIAIKSVEPYLTPPRLGSARFGGFTNLRRLSRSEVETDCTVLIAMDGGDLPYRRIVVRQHGHLRLRRQGLLHWKIAKLTWNGDIGTLAK